MRVLYTTVAFFVVDSFVHCHPESEIEREAPCAVHALNEYISHIAALWVHFAHRCR